ncbi:HNH endonuclease [Niveispirillum sp.]|uniref:HNH endonuclease n=1 Tax=Niveispirillum sp. TaxID=1917217 RepID=UPI001B582EE6|nr:HNH endonuclease [Niveispirillum sp.]MBP7336877.1 HNH endonuclease [Niveispirillum sp.]
MPWSPPKPCAHPGCGALVHSRYCAAHQRAERAASDARRPSARERGYGSKWERARAEFLACNPWCVRCKEAGRQVQASHVDHITPHRGDDRLFWSRSNWQALCRPCHSSKTAAEDGGFGHRRRPAP